MDRRTALAKATTTTANSATALLDPERAAAFLWAIKDADTFGPLIRQEGRRAAAGKIDKASTASRIIRAAAENSDDGYRAGVAFTQATYVANKIRLPWEVTEDVFHENIVAEALESQITADMTRQFALDLSDLDINGDSAAGAGVDQAFLQINDGLLKQLVTAGAGTHRINGALVSSGAIVKAQFFNAMDALPVKYRNQGSLRWLCSPSIPLAWTEYLTDRNTAAGDAALTADGAGPLGIPFWPVASMPSNRMILTDPRNIVRVVTWDVRRRRVTGETDMELAAKDKRFYVFFIKEDLIIEELDAIVDVYGLVP
jgi:hypothetical protein